MDSHLFCDVGVTDCFSLQEMIERDMNSPFDPILGAERIASDGDDDHFACHFPPSAQFACANDQDSIDSFDNLQLRAGASHFTWFPGTASDVENSVSATTVIVNPHAAMPQTQIAAKSLSRSPSSPSSSSSTSSSASEAIEENLVTVANRNALAEALAAVARQQHQQQQHGQRRKQKAQLRRRHSDVTEDDSDSSPPPTPRVKAPRLKREPKAKARKLEQHGDPYGATGNRDDDDDDRAYPKPSYSYSCLIAMALKNSSTGCLPVSEIYSFMTENFPYFRTAPHGWKNSVRHNLSLNKCFEKIDKPIATNGTNKKGCLWTMNPEKVSKMEEEMQKWSRKDPTTIKQSMACPENLDILEKGFRQSAPVKTRKKASRPQPKVETITLQTNDREVSIPEMSFKGGLWNEMDDESLDSPLMTTCDDLHVTVSKTLNGGGGNHRHIYGRMMTLAHGGANSPTLLPLK